MALKRLTAFICLLFLAACGEVSNLAPRDQVQFAENFISLFPRHDLKEIEKLFVSEGDPQQFRPQIEAMYAVYPAEKLIKKEVIDWNSSETFGSSPSKKATLRILYHFEHSQDLLVTISLVSTSASYRVSGIYFEPLDANLRQRNAFHLQNEPWQDSAVLIFALIAFGLTVFALIACVRTKGMHRKWLWIIFILFGVGKLSVNWSTGAATFQLLALQLFSASLLQASAFEPWYISISFPLGAVVFLARRKAILEAIREEVADQFGLPEQGET